MQVACAQPATSMAQSVWDSLESATGQKLAPSLAGQGLGAYVHLAELRSSAAVGEGRYSLSPALHRYNPWFPNLPANSLKTFTERTCFPLAHSMWWRWAMEHQHA